MSATIACTRAGSSVCTTLRILSSAVLTFSSEYSAPGTRRPAAVAVATASLASAARSRAVRSSSEMSLAT